MTDLIKELDAVALLADRLDQLSDAVAKQQWNEFSMRVPAEPARDADLVLASVARFIRTHHAEIAEAVKDAALWRYMVRENNKGGRGAFRIVWFDERDDGFTTTDGVSVDGKDEQAIIRIVSDAMHNSAREGGE